MFDVPPPIRKVTYTTNIIKSVNSVIRKFIRNRKQYPSRDSALKIDLHGASRNLEEVDDSNPKMERSLEPLRNLFEGRMPNLS